MVVLARNGAVKGHGTNRAQNSSEAQELGLGFGFEGSGSAAVLDVSRSTRISFQYF